MENPNERLTPIYIGEKLVWIPVIEYYAKIGGAVINRTEKDMTQCLVCSHWHNSLCGCCDESDYYRED